MAWVNRQVQYQFSQLVYNLSEFHRTYGKEKNQIAFNAIADACKRMIELFSEKEMPKTFDVEMAGLLNIIETNINEVIRLKKGREKFQDFMKAVNQVNETKRLLSVEYKKNVQTLEEKKQQKSETKDILSIENLKEEKNQPPQILEDQEEHTSDIHIASLEELEGEINSLYQTPVHIYSWPAFFQSTWKGSWSHYPKLMGTSAATFTIGSSYALLSVFQEYVGPSLDAFLKNVTTIDLSNEYVLAGTFILTGVIAGGVALSKSAPKNSGRKLDNEEQQQEERVRLLSSKV